MRIGIAVPHLGPQTTLRAYALELRDDFEERFGEQNVKMGTFGADALKFIGRAHGAIVYITTHSQTQGNRHYAEACEVASKRPRVRVVIVTSHEENLPPPRKYRGRPTIIGRSLVKDSNDLAPYIN